MGSSFLFRYSSCGLGPLTRKGDTRKSEASPFSLGGNHPVRYYTNEKRKHNINVNLI